MIRIFFSTTSLWVETWSLFQLRSGPVTSSSQDHSNHLHSHSHLRPIESFQWAWHARLWNVGRSRWEPRRRWENIQTTSRKIPGLGNKPTTFDNTSNCATILASQVLQPRFKLRYWNNSLKLAFLFHQSFSLIESLESSLSHFGPPLSTTNTFFVIKGHFVHFFKCFVVFCNGQGWLWLTRCRQLTEQLLKVLPQRVGTDQPTHKPTDCLFTLLTFQVWNQWQSVRSLLTMRPLWAQKPK